jgi:hypothetical protein
MTEYTPRNGQEPNSLLANAHMVLPHYSSNGGASYIYSNGHVPYTAINAVYPTYTTAYSPNNNITHFTPEGSQMAIQYQQNSINLAVSLSQRSTVAQPQYLASQPSMQQYTYANRLIRKTRTPSTERACSQSPFHLFLRDIQMSTSSMYSWQGKAVANLQYAEVLIMTCAATFTTCLRRSKIKH